jgi:hypothetical protein
LIFKHEPPQTIGYCGCLSFGSFVSTDIAPNRLGSYVLTSLQLSCLPYSPALLRMHTGCDEQQIVEKYRRSITPGEYVNSTYRSLATCPLTFCHTELSDHNNLWAHIEAYTSTFTTCLRTLRSLTHGLTSVIGRIRSLLSRTKTTLRASDRACERKGADMLYQGSVENRKIGWYELQSEEANAEVHALPCGGDAEVMSFQSDSILVKKTFASQGT